MKRFENAVIGDAVWSDTFGEGVIEERIDGFLIVNFKTQIERNGYTVEGCFIRGTNIPSLFYRTAESNYLTERPLPKLDWSKVPMDTKISADGFRRYFNKGLPTPTYFEDGKTSWSNNAGTILQFDNVRNRNITLAEPVIIDGITWPVGTKWEGK